MRDIECLYISPEKSRVGVMHRRFSVKELADMLVANSKISDSYMTYIHMLHFKDAHEFISQAQFRANKITTPKKFELVVNEIINVPAAVLISPLQLMTSVAYYQQREDPYAMSAGPVIKPFDVDEDVEQIGWTIQTCSSDI